MNAGPTGGGGFGLLYDTATIQAAERLAPAHADFAAVRGTPQAWFAFKRWRSCANLVATQSEGIHLTYGVSRRGNCCACGLIAPAAFDNPLLAPGHLNFTTWRPEPLVMGIPAVTRPSLVAERRYAVHCHVCGWFSPEQPLQAARRAAASHAH